MSAGPDLQSLVGPQLRAFADVLADQPEAIADAASLCEGWAVRHVVAHVTMAARYEGPAFTAELEAYGRDFGALSEGIARRDAALPFGRLLEDLRSDTMARWAPPDGGAAGALSHVVIHALDVTAAVGLPRTSSDEATVAVLDALVAGMARRFGTDVAGRRLRAIDLVWESGTGRVVEATAADLVLAMAARPREGVDL